MADRWLVDGMNVVGSRPADRWWRDREAARARLASRLRRFVEETGDRVAVVFDGRPSERVRTAGGEVEVGFASGGPNAADDEIVARLEGERDPGGISVVTSDRALADRARRRGAEVVSAQSFLARLDRVGG